MAIFLKVAGSYKEAADSFIKVNGVWVKTTKEYLKLNGVWVDETTAHANPPKVLSSKIYANNSHRILVEWDTEMKGSADIRFAISIIVNGAQPIVPNAVTFNKKYMTLSDNFKAGDVITWAYDDQNSTELLSTKVGDVEADNQTYGVTNTLVQADTPLTKPSTGDIDASGDIAGVTPTGTFVDFVITKGVNSDSTERGYKDPTTGASTGPFGSINKTLIEAGADLFGAYARIYPRAGNKVSLDLEVVLKANDDTIDKIWMKVGGKMYPLLHYPTASYVVNSTEGFDAFNTADATVTIGLKIERKAVPPPPDGGADDILDLDGDGLPDEVLVEFDGATMTHDDDSVNIDFDGDGIADLVIPK